MLEEQYPIKEILGEEYQLEDVTETMLTKYGKTCNYKITEIYQPNLVDKLRELINAGLKLNQIDEKHLYYGHENLQKTIKPEMLYAAGFTDVTAHFKEYQTWALREAGYKIDDYKTRGTSVLIGGGYTLKEFTDSKRRCKRDIYIKHTATYIWKIRTRNKTVERIKNLRDQGFSATELYSVASYAFSLPNLIRAGFTKHELIDPKIPLKELKEAGFTTKDLKYSGVPNNKILELGWSLKDLKEAGFSIEELQLIGIKFNFLDGHIIVRNNPENIFFAPKQLTIEDVKNFVSGEERNQCSLFMQKNEEPLEDSQRIHSMPLTSDKLTLFALKHTVETTPQQQKLLFTEKELKSEYNLGGSKEHWSPGLMKNMHQLDQNRDTTDINALAQSLSQRERAYLLGRMKPANKNSI